MGRNGTAAAAATRRRSSARRKPRRGTLEEHLDQEAHLAIESDARATSYNPKVESAMATARWAIPLAVEVQDRERRKRAVDESESTEERGTGFKASLTGSRGSLSCGVRCVRCVVTTSRGTDRTRRWTSRSIFHRHLEEGLVRQSSLGLAAEEGPETTVEPAPPEGSRPLFVASPACTNFSSLQNLRGTPMPTPQRQEGPGASAGRNQGVSDARRCRKCRPLGTGVSSWDTGTMLTDLMRRDERVA